MRDSVDIFRSQIFAKIDKTVKITKVFPPSFDRQTIQLCNLKWIDENSELGFGAGATPINRIVDALQNQIEIPYSVEGEDLKVGDILTIMDPLIFINGTRIVANNEWKLNSEYDVQKGVPLVWLHETIKEKFHDSPSSFERETTYRIFLLNDVSALETNNEKRAGAVRAMYGLFGEIKKAIENNKQLKRAGDIDVVSFSYFGTEDKQGIIKAILDADLGGLDVKLDVLIYPPCTNC